MGFDSPGGEPTPHRWRVGVTIASAVLVFVVVAFFVVGPGTVGGVTIARQSAPVTAANAAPTADATRPAQADDIKDLVAKYGEPPDATFARLKVPKLGIDAGVSPRVVTGSEMPLPDGPENVAWYDMSKFSGLGGTPGGGHNAIFGAHVDFNNHINYTNTHFIGPAVFYHLDELVPGDIIEVVYKGKTLKYQVAWARKYPTDGAVDWGSLWSGNVKVDSITLFTCGGTFDYDTHEYSDRFVIRAERV